MAAGGVEPGYVEHNVNLSRSQHEHLVDVLRLVVVAGQGDLHLVLHVLRSQGPAGRVRQPDLTMSKGRGVRGRVVKRMDSRSWPRGRRRFESQAR